MMLWEALGLENTRIVALVGGGGKTTSLFLLGQELAGLGKKVVLATTARMFEPDSGEVPLLLESRTGIISRRVAEILAESNQVLVGAGKVDGKLTGLSCELLQELVDLPQVDIVIVEADGSRGKPLKFPAQHEPVICSADALVVPVMGVLGLGEKLTEQHFHRVELARDYLGLDQETVVTPQVTAEMLLHPRGYGRFIGVNRVVPLINQVETPEQENLAWELARELMVGVGIHRVVVSAVGTSQPVRAVIHRDEEEKE